MNAAASNAWLVLFAGLTAFATLWAIWQRFHYAERPTWTVTRTTRLGAMAEAPIEVEVLNVGDGDAFGVSAEVPGLESHRRLSGQSRLVAFPIGRLPAGESFLLAVSVPVKSGSLYLDERSGLYMDDRELATNSFKVVVRWRQPPRRGKVRRKVLRAEVPQRATE